MVEIPAVTPPSAPGSALRRLRTIAVLAVTQLIGWGTTFDMPGVSGRAIAADLGISNEVSFAGLSVMMVVAAVTGPAVGRALGRYDAARVLAVGSVLLGLGLALMSQAQGAASLLAAWAVIGLGGALGLTVGAHTAVVERQGGAARRTIGLLMIFTGFSSALFWPVLSLLDGWFGWRATCLITAAAHIVVCLPLHLVGLPPHGLGQTPVGGADAATERPQFDMAEQRRAFGAIAVVLTLFGFVTFGLSPSLIEVLRLSGASPEAALQLGSIRSVLGIGARVVDYGLGRRGSPLVTATLGAALMFLAFGLLFGASGTIASVIVFVVIYGFGSGIASMARATLPLQFFVPEAFGRQAGRLALPQNLATAVAPVIFTAVLDRGGVVAICGLAAGSIVVALSACAVLAAIGRGAAARRMARARDG